MPDLRAGFAYVMAALIASGTSTLSGLPFLERGYEDLINKLAALGAEVDVTKESETRNPLVPSKKLFVTA